MVRPLRAACAQQRRTVEAAAVDQHQGAGGAEPAQIEQVDGVANRDVVRFPVRVADALIVAAQEQLEAVAAELVLDPLQLGLRGLRGLVVVVATAAVGVDDDEP